MRFPRDFCRGFVVPTVGSSLLVRQQGRFPMYERIFGSAHGGYSGFAVVSATLRLLVLIAMDGMYVCFAGAKKETTKKHYFFNYPLVGIVERSLILSAQLLCCLKVIKI